MYTQPSLVLNQHFHRLNTNMYNLLTYRVDSKNKINQYAYSVFLSVINYEYSASFSLRKAGISKIRLIII